MKTAVTTSKVSSKGGASKTQLKVSSASQKVTGISKIKSAKPSKKFVKGM